MAKPDFSVANHGSILLLQPLSKAAKAWVEENISGEEVQYWAGAVVVEPRYLGNIVEGIRGDGLTVA